MVASLGYCIVGLVERFQQVPPCLQCVPPLGSVGFLQAPLACQLCPRLPFCAPSVCTAHESREKRSRPDPTCYDENVGRFTNDLAMGMAGTGGYWWVLVGTSGYWWVLVGTGWYWGVLVGTGGYWGVLVGTGGYWWVPGGTGGHWWVLVGTGGYWWVLAGTGGYWWVLVGTGGYWWVLVGTGG